MVNQKLKKRAIHRAKIMEGQFKGLIKAIEDEKYCIDLITQSLAIQNSLKSLETLLLENHLRSHVKNQMTKKGEDERAISELVKIYTLSAK